MEGAGASADEDALRAYLEEHPMPQRRSEEEGEEDEEEGEGDAAGAAAERDAEERRVQRHLLGTMMESAGPFPFERGLREMEEHNASPEPRLELIVERERQPRIALALACEPQVAGARALHL